MNAREYNGYVVRFFEKTGIDLWTAVQRQGLQLGFFIDTLDDLIGMSKDEEDTFKKLVTNLEKIFCNETGIITERRIVYAMAISLFNTHPDVRRKKIEESYIAELFITQDTARDILSRYEQRMSNPVGMLVDPEHIYHSILKGQSLDQPLVYVKNGPRNKPRPIGALATKRQFNLLEIESIEINAYHPTIWYLLRENRLVEYKHLFNNAIELCNKWIQNSIQKHRKMQEV